MMRGGAIVAVSSHGAGRVIPGYGAMGPAKAALESLVRYLAAELAPLGVRVNAVSAGLTAGTGVAEMEAGKEVLNFVKQRTPAGRVGSPEDIADVILFLTAPASRWICGQCLVADGGYSLW
jgi:enoyl-[acyl-carrier protein] reductase III